MSFGFSPSDFVLVIQLAYSTVQNAKRACGTHSALAREVNSLHVVLVRLGSEVSRPESILSGGGSSETGSSVDRDGDGREEKRKELAELVRDCERVLKVLKEILEKYNALSDEKRSVQKLWQKVKFGNGEMQDLDKIRSELATYTQAITLSLNLVGLGSQGKVERYMESHGDELREIKASLNWVTAKLQVKEGSTHGERSILSSYVGDDKEVWKMFRRELIKDGFSSRVLGRHKETIKKYVMELGARGVLDDMIPDAANEDDATEPTIQNGARLDRDVISSLAVGLVERALPGDAENMEDRKGDLEDLAITVPEAFTTYSPSITPTSVQDHPRSTIDFEVEQESDSGNDGSAEEAEAEDYSGSDGIAEDSEDEHSSRSDNEVTSQIGDDASVTKPSATASQGLDLSATASIPAREFWLIKSDLENDSNLDSDSNDSDKEIEAASPSKNRKTEVPETSAKPYVQPYVIEVEDDESATVQLELEEGEPLSSVDGNEGPFKDRERTGAVLGSVVDAASINMKAREEIQSMSRSPISALSDPNRKSMSKANDHEQPGLSERARTRAVKHLSKESDTTPKRPSHPLPQQSTEPSSNNFDPGSINIYSPSFTGNHSAHIIKQNSIEITRSNSDKFRSNPNILTSSTSSRIPFAAKGSGNIATRQVSPDTTSIERSQITKRIGRNKESTALPLRVNPNLTSPGPSKTTRSTRKRKSSGAERIQKLLSQYSTSASAPPPPPDYKGQVWQPISTTTRLPPPPPPSYRGFRPPLPPGYTWEATSTASQPPPPPPPGYRGQTTFATLMGRPPPPPPGTVRIDKFSSYPLPHSQSNSSYVPPVETLEGIRTAHRYNNISNVYANAPPELAYIPRFDSQGNHRGIVVPKVAFQGSNVDD